MKYEKLKSIKKVKGEKIYHLTIKNNHNFFGNNLCLHNCDYTPPNEIKIIIYNLGDEPYIIENGQRIAQGVFCPVIQANIVEIEEISDEDVNRNRGGGFGSTGIK